MEKVIIYYKMEEDNNNTEYKVVGKIGKINEGYILEFIEPDTKLTAIYKIYNDRLELERKGSLYMKTCFMNNMTTDCQVITEFNYEMNINLNTFFYNIEKENDCNMFIKVKYNLDIDLDNIHILTLDIKNKNISIAKK